MDVGIEDCLHIEFEYSKSKYHLKDVIVGRIYFLLVRLKIKHMELSIIRRETTGSPPNQYNESETLVRFEVCELGLGCLLLLAVADTDICRLWTGRLHEVGVKLTSPNSSFRLSGLTICRRNHSYPPVPRRVRPDPDIPRCEQEVLNEILP
jgi:hypothetical protein